MYNDAYTAEELKQMFNTIVYIFYDKVFKDKQAAKITSRMKDYEFSEREEKVIKENIGSKIITPYRFIIGSKETNNWCNRKMEIILLFFDNEGKKLNGPLTSRLVTNEIFGFYTNYDKYPFSIDRTCKRIICMNEKMFTEFDCSDDTARYTILEVYHKLFSLLNIQSFGIANILSRYYLFSILDKKTFDDFDRVYYEDTGRYADDFEKIFNRDGGEKKQIPIIENAYQVIEDLIYIDGYDCFQF